MASYKLFFRRSAEKELRKISSADLRKVVKKIDLLVRIPRPDSTQMLKGGSRYYRIRQGNCRVVYEVDDSVREVTIIKISHRNDVYQ